MKLKFSVGEIPIDYILGNMFLAKVEPHWSARLTDGKAGYCISVPNHKGFLETLTLPYVSTPRISTMVHTMQEVELLDKKIEELKDFKSSIRIKEQLQPPRIIQKIAELRKHLETECCSEKAKAFWHRKKHTVEFPFQDKYEGKPCKSRAIPMNRDYRNLCKKEMSGLLQKGLTR